MFKRLFLIIISCLQINIVSADEILPTNGSEPIEIISDTLRMFQADNKAIFEGKVKAVQGMTKLDCDYMVVYFEEKAPAEEKKIGGDDTKIKKIDFSGNVIIITETDKATGKRGDYNVKTGVFNLYDDVKLFQKKNVLTGDKLVYNKNTGESMLSNDSKKSKKRVKALLIPEEDGGK